MTLFKGAISIVSNNPYEVLVSKGAAGQLVNKSQGQKRELITLFHKEYSWTDYYIEKSLNPDK